MIEKVNKNVVIAALARDCEKALPRIINLIEELRELLLWSQVVVVENDSRDNTKNILFDWEARQSNVKIISQDFGTLTIPEQLEGGIKPLISLHRIEKMAFYRNIYLNYIKNIQHNIDNVVVIDLDIDSFSVDGVLQSILKCEDSCGAIFANGITTKKLFGNIYSKIYYDVFAVYEYPLKYVFSYTDKTLLKTLKSVTDNLDKNHSYSVISGFGGVSVYNFKAISNLEYKVEPNGFNSREAVCEHIPFNTEIVKLGYENFISEELEVIYGEHSFGSILKYYLPKPVFEMLFKVSKIFK